MNSSNNNSKMNNTNEEILDNYKSKKTKFKLDRNSLNSLNNSPKKERNLKRNRTCGKIKKKENNNNKYSQNKTSKNLHYNKNQKKGKYYKTLLDILEKRKQKESAMKSDRHLTNSEFSFNDLNSINNNYDRISTGITNREGTGTYNKTTRNNRVFFIIKG